MNLYLKNPYQYQYQYQYQYRNRYQSRSRARREAGDRDEGSDHRRAGERRAQRSRQWR